MHYVAFLMDHGMAPYRQIIDINGPGAYMSEWLIMHTFGPSSLAWRIYDYFLIVGITGILIWLTASRDWMAGAFAGLLLGCYHIANGPNELGERDWTILLLALAGYAALFYALRHRKPRALFFFGLLYGAAVGIKPLVSLIPLVLLGIACVVLHRRGERLSRFIFAAMLGVIPSFAAFIGFLLYWHAFKDFYTIFEQLVPFYVGFGNPSWETLWWGGLGHYVSGLTLLACVLAVWERSRLDYESVLLAMGPIFGFFLYLVQRKGFIYHRASLTAFAFLWIAIQGYAAIASRRRWRWLGGAVLLVLLLARLFHYWLPLAHSAAVDESRVVLLESQLRTLGGQKLNGKVQCVDVVQGCINTLYNLGLQQSTGFISDFFLFQPNHLPIFDSLRGRFIADLKRRPPEILIVAPFVWDVNAPTYAQLDNWPVFEEFLKTYYQQIAEERKSDGSIDFFTYRLYVLRKGTQVAD